MSPRPDMFTRKSPTLKPLPGGGYRLSVSWRGKRGLLRTQCGGALHRGYCHNSQTQRTDACSRYDCPSIPEILEQTPLPTTGACPPLLSPLPQCRNLWIPSSARIRPRDSTRRRSRRRAATRGERRSRKGGFIPAEDTVKLVS